MDTAASASRLRTRATFSAEAGGSEAHSPATCAKSEMPDAVIGSPPPRADGGRVGLSRMLDDPKAGRQHGDGQDASGNTHGVRRVNLRVRSNSGPVRLTCLGVDATVESTSSPHHAWRNFISSRTAAR